jgi:hypothetical protein
MVFCQKCGAEISSDATFCSKCGNPVAFPPTSPLERKPARGEKKEKGEKGEKGEKHEKEEKPRDMLLPVMGGLILIWLGLTLYLSQIGTIPSDDLGGYFMIGVGVILLAVSTIRYMSTAYKGLTRGYLIGGVVLIVFGAMDIVDVSDWWFLGLIAIGVIIIIAGITSMRRTPKPSI